MKKKQIWTQTNANGNARGGAEGAGGAGTGGGAGTDRRSGARKKNPNDAVNQFIIYCVEPDPRLITAASSSSSSSSPSPLPALSFPYLRTSPKVTIRLLRKYLARRLGLPSSSAGAELSISLAGELLGTDHSLEFIKRTRWHEKNKHMTLHYSHATVPI